MGQDHRRDGQRFAHDGDCRRSRRRFNRAAGQNQVSSGLHRRFVRARS
jgi:hypothetical protein